MQIKDASWMNALEGEFSSPYMDDLRSFIVSEKQQGKTIYPKTDEYFRALDLTPIPNVKVVVLGQDPYHGESQAHGLSFSVRPGVRVPPSLRNIYKELSTDVGVRDQPHGFLEDWARQGVLLLNSVLTVQAAHAASHQKRGWEQLTDAMIRAVNDHADPSVFLLWGAHAQKKAGLVDQSKHLVLTAVHPSPLSAHRGFFGCKHFSKANAFLSKHKRSPIQWALPQ